MRVLPSSPSFLLFIQGHIDHLGTDLGAGYTAVKDQACPSEFWDICCTVSYLSKNGVSEGWWSSVVEYVLSVYRTLGPSVPSS